MDECHATLATDETAEVQSLQTNKKYWISGLHLEVFLFSSSKSKIVSLKEKKLFLQKIPCGAPECLAPLGISVDLLSLFNQLNHEEIRMRFSNKLHNSHCRVASLPKCCWTSVTKGSASPK